MNLFGLTKIISSSYKYFYKKKNKKENRTEQILKVPLLKQNFQNLNGFLLPTPLTNP